MSFLIRLSYRSFYYLRIAVSLVSFPFTFLTFLSVFYQYVDFMPFTTFIAVSVTFALIVLPLFGWYWRKNSGFYKAERDVDVHFDPYTTTKVTPVTVALYEPWVLFLENNGYDCEKIRAILKNSGASNLEEKR